MNRENNTCQQLGFDAVALHIARTLVSQAEGPLDDPTTWESIGNRRGYIFYPFFGETSSFLGEIIFRPGRSPVIAYNSARPRQEQARIVIHEVAHGILAEDDPDNLTGRMILCHGYDEPPTNLRHNIARQVEILISLAWQTDSELTPK